MKYIVYISIIISILSNFTFAQDTVSANIFLSSEAVKKEVESLTPSMYKARYKEEDLMFKIVDNYGNKFDKLYGARNMRPVLHGIAYRGGANNYFHKTAKRKNQNPLPNDGLVNLCQEGFGSSVYLYRTNSDSSFTEVKCNCIDGDKNKMDYFQYDYFDDKHVYEMIKMVYESATDSSKGPVYLHCWNGWHASGFLAAVILKQFCGYNDIDAVAYWDLGTDGANRSPHYRTVRKRIRDFEAFPEFMLEDEMGNSICPPMPKMVDKTKSHIDIEQLVIVPEAIPVNYRIILYDVIFQPNQTTIANVDSLREIKNLMAAMNKYPDLKVEVGGHTDRSGSEADNKVLSKNRAKYIYDLMINNDIASNRISYKGYGSSIPAYSNSTKSGRNANRRIEIKIVAKKDYGKGKLVDESAFNEKGFKKISIIKYNSVKKDERYILENLTFPPNITTITNENNKDLKKVLGLLNNNAKVKIEIGGYTDISGIKEKNDSLSEERAKAVYHYLVKKGINPTRLTYKGYGPLKPIADNRFRWGRDKNRRIEIKILN